MLKCLVIVVLAIALTEGKYSILLFSKCKIIDESNNW